MTARHVDRYSRTYSVRIFDRTTGADVSDLYGGADGVILTSTSRRRGLSVTDARDAVTDYFIRRGWTTDAILNLRIVITD